MQPGLPGHGGRRDHRRRPARGGGWQQLGTAHTPGRLRWGDGRGRRAARWRQGRLLQHRGQRGTVCARRITGELSQQPALRDLGLGLYHAGH